MQENVWSVTDVDGLLAFALFASLLFTTELGTLGGLLFSGFSLAYGLFRFFRLHEIFASRWFLLFIPFLTVFSVIWSDMPKETLKYSIEYTLTVGVALLLSAAPRPKAVLFGIVAAFAVYAVVSLAFGQNVEIGETGQEAFSGLTQGKNRIAEIAAIGLLASAVLFLVCREDRRRLLALGALVAVMIQLYVLYRSRSAGALVGLALSGGALAFLLVLRSAGIAARTAVTVLLGLCLLAAALASRWLSEALIEAGTRFFAKDPTLTGRTYLWQRASELIAERPTFGRGFHVFWQQGNLDAEGLWQFAQIENRSGFNFHNTPIEVLVHLGWVGLIVCAAILIVGSCLLIARYIVRPDLVTCFWLTMLVYHLVRMPIETVGFNEFYHPTVLMFAALGSAFAPLRDSYARMHAYRASASPGMPLARRADARS